MSESNEHLDRHPIGVVAERTGLSQELLRVWERRYGAVQPERTEGGQRLYSDGDVERLQLLRLATQGGRAISTVARLPESELKRLVHDDDLARARVGGGETATGEVALDMDVALGLARDLNGPGLETILLRASTLLGAPRFLEEVVAPFMERVGIEWHGGRLSPAHEHLATASVQRVVVRVLGTLGEPEGGPAIVVAAPTGERHEIGALLAAAAAASEGWKVVYLGPDLPGADIAAAAVATRARAVGLSVVYVDRPERVAAEVRAAREGIPASVPLLVGGSGARAVASALGDLEVLWVSDLDSLRSSLRRWKQSTTPSRPER